MQESLLNYITVPTQLTNTQAPILTRALTSSKQVQLPQRTGM